MLNKFNTKGAGAIIVDMNREKDTNKFKLYGVVKMSNKIIKCECCANEFTCIIFILPPLNKNEYQAYCHAIKDKNEILLDNNYILDTYINDDGKKVYKLYGYCPCCNEYFETEIIE